MQAPFCDIDVINGMQNYYFIVGFFLLVCFVILEENETFACDRNIS